MNLQARKEIFVRLGEYMLAGDAEWQAAKEKASGENPWFTGEFINLAAKNIATQYLAAGKLQLLIDKYHLPNENPSPKKVGIVMAGNIPMVGFHDLLCTVLAGHHAVVKLSSKDTVLLTFLVKKLISFNPAVAGVITINEMLKNCDAYIATGSNNSSGYFAYYFSKYPHIIRKNRTSVAILTGEESAEELEKLADDVYQYFGLGCRNVTKIFVPEGYQFEPLLKAFGKYNHLADHQKYKNNYDYHLAIHLLNNHYFMSNPSLLVVEQTSVFSPISQLNYQYYKNKEEIWDSLSGNESIQCVVGKGAVPFGEAQYPGVCDFADGVDTMQFLVNLTGRPEVRKA